MNSKKLWKRVGIMLVLGGLYLGVFFLIEARDVPIHIIHTALDDRIPFCEYFIIPYVLWYFYVAGTFAYLGLAKKDLKGFRPFVANMALGILIFVVVSLVYPNGQDLRPSLPSDNGFLWAVNFLYGIDTPTNILPSLHVYASVVCDIALSRDSAVRRHPPLRWVSLGLTILISLSTMFLKQHSVVDVVTALFCNIVCYLLVYHWKAIRSQFSHKASKKGSLS